MIATVINVILILLGSALGLISKNRTSSRFSTGLTFALGLCVLGIGITSMMATDDTLCVIVCMVIGTLLGEGIPSGTVVAVPGCCLASTDPFRLTIRGKGSHGSMPETGVDPIRTGALVLLGWDGLLSREVPASQAAVLTVGRFAAGNTGNVIPETAVLEGTLRTLDPAVRRLALRRLEELAQGIAAANRAEAVLEIGSSAPPVINTPEMAELAAKAAGKWLPPEKVWNRPVTPSMVSEDFAWYLEKAPGAFLMLSAPQPDPAKRVGHHNPRFDIDEGVLWEGAAVLAQTAADFLEEG